MCEHYNDNTASKRLIYLDILTITACLAVLFLHHNNIVHVYQNTIEWKEALVVQVVCYWAVPVFLMISGANLMKYRNKYSTKTFFVKRLFRVLIPWIVWSIIMLIWTVKVGYFEIDDYSIVNLLNILLNSKMMGIYWFFPAIIGIYLFTPFLSLLAEKRCQKTMWLIVAIFFVLNATVPMICTIFHVEWNTNISIPMRGDVIHFILGYLCSEVTLNKRNVILIYSAAICSMILRYIGIVIQSNHYGEIRRDVFFNYNYIFSYILAIAVFIFVKRIPWDNLVSKLNKRHIIRAEIIIAKIAGCSLGIYLIQIPIMHYERLLFNVTEYSFVYRTVMPLLTYIIALCIVLVLKKIPFLKIIVP